MLLADVGVLQNVESLGVGGHQAVFDAVVDHLDEMAGTRWTTVKVTLFGRAPHFLAARSSRSITTAGSERFEDGIETLYDVIFAANHLAIAALESPNSTARANVDVVNALCGELLGAANIVDVVGVAAVDQDVAGF